MIDLRNLENQLHVANNSSVKGWLVDLPTLNEMVATLKAHDAQLVTNAQALADSNLALMEQTELAEKLRQQAETLEAELLRVRAQLDGDEFKIAYMEWSEKTDWVQEHISASKDGWRYLGMHRADVMKMMIDELRASAPQQPAQAALSDEQIVAIKKQSAGRYNSALHITDQAAIEFARAILAASQQPAAAPAKTEGCAGFQGKPVTDCGPCFGAGCDAAAPADSRIADQVAKWRKEVARLTDLIAHATGEVPADSRANGDGAALKRVYQARRFCKGDNAWTDWQTIPDKSLQSYLDDKSFEVRVGVDSAAPAVQVQSDKD